MPRSLFAALAAFTILVSAPPALAQDVTPQQNPAPSVPESDAGNPPAAGEGTAQEAPAASAQSDAKENAETEGDVKPSGAAKSLSENPLATLSPEIVMLRAVGPWVDGDRKGFSRVVAVASGGSLKLYVQWIDQKGEVVETAELESAAQTPQLALAEVRVDAGDEDSSVYFDTPPDAQGFRETYVLIIERPGEARLGPAMN